MTPASTNSTTELAKRDSDITEVATDRTINDVTENHSTSRRKII